MSEPQKKDVIIFTTRSFNENEYLFTINNFICYTYIPSVLLFSKSVITNFIIDNNKKLIYSDDSIIQDYLSNNDERIDALQELFPLEYEIIINQVKEKITLQDIYKNSEDKNFSNRQFIAQINDKEIYAYRCLDTGYSEEVLGGDNVKKGFITAIVTDVALKYQKEAVAKLTIKQRKETNDEKINLIKIEIQKIENEKVLDFFFKQNKLTLILHDDDIDEAQLNRKLDNKNNKLYENNSELSSYYRNITTYTFFHSYGIFYKILTDYKKTLRVESIDEISVELIIEAIKNYMKYKKIFLDDEKSLFKKGNKLITKDGKEASIINHLKDNLTDNFSDLKIF